MKSTEIAAPGAARTLVLVLDAGEAAHATITAFAARHGVTAASVSAIGAFQRATLGWFDLAAKTYRPIEVDEQCEALSLLGDIAVDDAGKPSLHLHAVVGLRDGQVRGGHLMEAIVRPTLEVTLTETPASLRRRKRPDLGIALIDLG